MLMIFTCITFEVPNPNEALPITNKLKDKENICADIVLFCILVKEK
jgi:hypothetical protein